MLRTLRRIPELGVNFIDTADSYGPDVSEWLIREALHPYKGLFVATKAGLTRPGPDAWLPNGRPEYLLAEAQKSLANLGVEQIDLWQLHRIDPKVPRHEQFDTIKQLLETKVIRFAGLSEVSVEDIEAASKVFPVATVQNRYNLVDRGAEDVLEYSEKHGIGFIPWFPLGAGGLAKSKLTLAAVAERYGATTGQIALAWLLKRSPVMLPIPGHLEGGAPGGERRCGRHRAVRRRLRRARRRRARLMSDLFAGPEAAPMPLLRQRLALLQ